MKGRGVAVRSGQTLKDLYNERCPLYEKYAQIIVDSEGLTLAETVEIIEARLREQ